MNRALREGPASPSDYVGWLGLMFVLRRLRLLYLDASWMAHGCPLAINICVRNCGRVDVAFDELRQIKHKGYITSFFQRLSSLSTKRPLRRNNATILYERETPRREKRAVGISGTCVCRKPEARPIHEQVMKYYVKWLRSCVHYCRLLLSRGVRGSRLLHACTYVGADEYIRT